MRTPRETFGLEGSGRSWSRVMLDVLSGALVLFGIAFIVGNASTGNSTAIWIGSVIILVGVVCWVIDILLALRSARRGPRNPSR